MERHDDERPILFKELHTDMKLFDAGVHPDEVSPSKTGLHRTCRIALLGDSGIGKTTFLRRMITGEYVYQTRPTIGTDFHILRVVFADGWSMLLEVYDTAGGDRASSIPRVHLRIADVVFLMYDIEKRESYEGLTEWNRLARHLSPKNVIKIIIGTKVDRMTDVEEQRKEEIRVRGMAAALDADASWLVSSVTGVNVAHAVASSAKRAREKKGETNGDCMSPMISQFTTVRSTHVQFQQQQQQRQESIVVRGCENTNGKRYTERSSTCFC